ncbi:MAG: threonine aldolase [Chloroflexi bacterium]|uniref:Beta-eliminating lyase-related protein n=1 Tax=Candidatus Chlorohelix allophototropha TaxID=3003348 RepID=A0A8T7MA89_9CHLR|nr:threonine aldolase [Chloroflexota bacterium]WJW68764.1 beta-eliminating lyase-related protein [Chloroflexota bacterium L227-S17]
MNTPKARELRAQCTRYLTGHKPLNQREWLLRLAESPYATLRPDMYNDGPAMEILEKEVAELLGKPAAIFLPKGVTAQLAALKVWTQRSRINTVAVHPKSHIDSNELNAIERYMGISLLRVGTDYQPYTLPDLEKLNEPIGAIVVELPLRNAGYKLPTWDELTAISGWAHERQIPLHFDGARLWESAYYYGRTCAEISALADSVYVSFYKGLGGMAGCVLAGAPDFIAEAKVWRTRLGGNIWTVFPFVLSALEGLHHHLPRMAEYCGRAREIAALLSQIAGLRIAPEPPHTNAFQLFLPAPLSALETAVLQLAETERTWLFGFFLESAIPGYTVTEFTVGEATLEWSDAEIVASVTRLLELAKMR